MFLTSKLIICYIDGFIPKRHPNLLIIHSMKVNIYIETWTLKMKCTQYTRLYRQAVSQNARAILYFEVKWSRQQFSTDIIMYKNFRSFLWRLPGGVVESQPSAPFHLPMKVRGGGCLMSTNLIPSYDSLIQQRFLPH